MYKNIISTKIHATLINLLLNSFYTLWGIILFIAMLITCITIPIQNTISTSQKMVGLGINLLLMGLCWHAVLGDPTKDKAFFGITCLILMQWYGYYTFVDATGITAHSPLISFIYVFIDISAFIYSLLYFVDNILIPYHIKVVLSNNPVFNILLNIASVSPLKKYIH